MFVQNVTVINEQQDFADGKQSEDPGINQGPGQALVKPKPGEICLRMDKYITAERRTNKTGRQSRLLRDQLTDTRRRIRRLARQKSKLIWKWDWNVVHPKMFNNLLP